MASFSATSCWCGVIWIWRYQRNITACDDTGSASGALRDSVMAACSPSTTSWSTTILVVESWCIDAFYERKCEREVRYNGLMIICCRSLLSNSATDDDIDDVSPKQLRQLCQRDAGTDRDSPSVTSLYTHWKLHGRYWVHNVQLSWNIVQTEIQNKIQISRHLKLNFSMGELDPTRPIL